MTATATFAASNMAHQLPPLLPHLGARVRPPRMLPGTVSPNTDPQPSGKVPFGKVWVQGRWRDRASNAAKHQRAIRVRQVAKALRHEAHGTSIYAYRHLRTNQVLYSLSRTLQNKSILKQLVFHGKKTVPRSLRRDMWSPYFAIKFPQNPAMAQIGLDAYRKLREFSLQRQLLPPEYLRLATEEDVAISKKKWRSPVEYMQREEKDELGQDVLELGQELPKRIRAIKLMNQRATSVADVSFVLGLVANSLHPFKKLEDSIARRKADLEVSNWRKQRRLRQTARDRAAEAKEIGKTAQLALENGAVFGNGLPLPFRELEQLSIEHQILLNRSGKLSGTLSITDEVANARANAAEWEAYLSSQEAFNKAETKYRHDMRMYEQKRAAHTKALARHTHASAQNDTSVDHPGDFTVPEPKSHGLSLPEKPSWAEDTEVHILWTDMNDGMWAKSWPGNVTHGELAAFAQPKLVGRKKGLTKTVHIIGPAGDGAREDMNRFYPTEIKRIQVELEGVQAQVDDVAEEVQARRALNIEAQQEELVVEPPKGWFGRLRERIGL